MSERTCHFCGEEPEVFFNGAQYRVIHANPCQLQGNHELSEYMALNSLTVVLDEPAAELPADEEASVGGTFEA